MARAAWIAVGCLWLCACEKQQAPVRKKEMRVAFGDCAPAATVWVSGPRPKALEPVVRVAATALTVQAEVDGPAPRIVQPPGGAQPKDGASAAALSGGSDDENIYGGLLGDEVGEMQGSYGFGLKGVGPAGGGGTGWGTIGTGNYGTIGHGSGTGRGYGVGGGRGGMRGKLGQVPMVSTGVPTVTGDLELAVIRRYFRRHVQRIHYCYERQLLVTPTLAGVITTQFTINANGRVEDVTSSGIDPAVSSCIKDVLAKMEFPRPRAGRSVRVKYPLTFRPSLDADVPSNATEAPGAGSGSAVGAGSDAAGADAGVPADAAPPAVAVAPPAGQGYEPGARHPLRDRSEALADCFRANQRPYGEVVVELGYDATGAATATTVHGEVDDAVRGCVATTARAAKRPAAPASAERCGIAFGAMAVADLAGVDVTADAVVYDGKTVTSIASVMKTDVAASGAVIDALRDAIRPRVDAVLAAKPPIVTLLGPGVIRPMDATPAKVVHAALASAAAAGDDFVLAAQHDGAWRLLRPAVLPIVPVPVGTGASWHQLKVLGKLPPDEPERPRLSILVTSAEIWIGAPHTGGFAKIARDAHEPANLASALATHKAKYFAERRDLEIAGVDDLPYRDLVHVIDAATAAGFTDWQLTNEAGLAARPRRDAP